MWTLTRNECPCNRAHLWPGSTFGNRWAASKVNSLKMSTWSLGLVHLGRPVRIIGPTRYTERPIGRAGWIILRTPEGPDPPDTCLTCGILHRESRIHHFGTSGF